MLVCEGMYVSVQGVRVALMGAPGGVLCIHEHGVYIC